MAKEDAPTHRIIGARVRNPRHPPVKLHGSRSGSKLSKAATAFCQGLAAFDNNSAGQPEIEGCAAVIHLLSEDLGGFRKQILPGTFANSLQNEADVRQLFNHDENNILGRTKSKVAL